MDERSRTLVLAIIWFILLSRSTGQGCSLITYIGRRDLFFLYLTYAWSHVLVDRSLGMQDEGSIERAFFFLVLLHFSCICGGRWMIREKFPDSHKPRNAYQTNMPMMESLSRYPAHITYDCREKLARYHHDFSLS
ncbi:hypothetical protein B0T20DRAFT_107712 [Sordaria brevicollis]|uniref:Uncharacterized protein n=1 Tax=Sordaria brevicollis TaxID=83679 RepID=A0AAE0NUX6_SORBR|nr:hypothetical protein B0T20DRAFT_107712 [Sordaria brevicollis]